LNDIFGMPHNNKQQNIMMLMNVLFSGEITTDHNVDIRDEPIEDTVQRMSDFLWILKYKPPVSDPYVHTQPQYAPHNK
jgi:hypothetical protein